MLLYIAKRLFRAFLTMATVLVLIFFLLRIAPSDPTAMLAQDGATEEQIAEIKALWGLDKPYGEQFVIYLKSLLSGDAGMSYQFIYGTPIYKVTELVMQAIPNTIKLCIASLIFSVCVSIPIGILMGLKPGSWFDNTMTSVLFVIKSFPAFVIGLILMLVFSLWLQILPTGGNSEPTSIILPMITVSLHFCVTLIMMTRTQFIKLKTSNYIRTCRAKGLSEFTIMFVHGLRNAAIPLVTLIGLRIGALLGGSVISETLFRWPGIGYLIITSVNARDYPTVQFLIPYVAFVFVMVNLLVDILYTVLDPRVKLDAKGLGGRS